jgi:hypothetical protein
MNGRERQEGGQDLIEYALIMPILLLLLFGIMDFGVTIFSYNTIANASREGARFGSVHCSSFRVACGADDAQVLAAAKQLTLGLNQANLKITQPAPSGGSITVQVDYKVDVIPFLTGTPQINLRTVSTMQTE